MIYNKRYLKVTNLVDLSVNTYLTFTFTKGSVPTGNFEDTPSGQSRVSLHEQLLCVRGGSRRGGGTSGGFSPPHW